MFTEDVVVPYSGTGSLLLEPQSTNLITYSEDFSVFWELNSLSSELNSIISPDGTQNASKLTITGIVPNVRHYSFLTTNNTYTISC